MQGTIEDFRSAGVLPTGPVSAWPKERNDELEQLARKEMAAKFKGLNEEERATKVKAGLTKQAGGVFKTAKALVRGGTVSKQIRNERYEVCKQCPAFIEDSKRCSECGCFMEAKTWVNDNPKSLCPRKKWVR